MICKQILSRTRKVNSKVVTIIFKSNDIYIEYENGFCELIQRKIKITKKAIDNTIIKLKKFIHYDFKIEELKKC